MIKRHVFDYAKRSYRLVFIWQKADYIIASLIAIILAMAAYIWGVK